MSVLAQDLDLDPCRSYDNLDCSVEDPEGLPDPDSLVRGTDPDPAPSFFHRCVERTEIMPAKENFNSKC
jgi:hypothetical protein